MTETKPGGFTLEAIGTYDSGIRGRSAAEIVAFSRAGACLAIVNGALKSIDLVDIADPARPALRHRIATEDLGGGINSVAASGSRLAAAIEAKDRQADGIVALFDLAGRLEATVPVGPLPDMLVFTPDGRHLLVANEGEPSEDYKKDPEGSLSIVDMESLRERRVRFAHLAPDGLHRPAPAGTTTAADLEPEYIAVTQDGRLAFVALQEANAIAVIDIAAAHTVRVFHLGEKRWPESVHGAPVHALYQPDGIAAFTHEGLAYCVGANEGDGRKLAAYREQAKIDEVELGPAFGGRRARLRLRKKLKGLKLSLPASDLDGDGRIDRLAVLGARSFAIWDETGRLVFESGDDLDRRLAALGREKVDKDKPEAIALGNVSGRRVLFLGMEKLSVLLAYDLTDPARPRFLTAAHREGDDGPEGLAFIGAEDSPIGAPLLVAANEVSGTTTIYRISAG